MRAALNAARVANRMTEYSASGTVASYTYGADNLRASKTVNGERTDFAWNGQNLAMEDTAETINTYTYDITGVHIANQNGKVVSYLKNYHNDIVGTIKPDGTVVESTDKQQLYDAWGNIVNSADFAPFGYTGEYLDSESGLIYLRNRYYNSATGRFITEDPAKDGVNWYAYCGNNPIMYVDPWGLFINGDQYLTPEHVGQVLLCTLIYYAGEKLNDSKIKDYASNAAAWYRNNDPKKSYHFGLAKLYSENSEANGDGVTVAFLDGLENMFSMQDDAIETMSQALMGNVAGTVFASIVNNLNESITPNDEFLDFWSEVEYINDLTSRGYSTQYKFELKTEASGSYIRVTYYNEDYIKMERDFMTQTFLDAVLNSIIL